MMRVQNRTLNQGKRYAFSLAPHDQVEIGILEADWSFRSGESVTLSAEGYSSIHFTVP